jgi:hypothetical protein
MQQPTPSPFGRVRVLQCNDTVAVAATGSICIAIWRGAVTKEPFEWQRAALAEVVKLHPGRAGFMCVIEANAKPPEDELRRASTQMVIGHGERLKCVACVIEGQGFTSAIHRGVLAGMALLLRNRKSETSVFATVDDASRWMAQFNVRPHGEELSSIVEQVRSGLLPRVKRA